MSKSPACRQAGYTLIELLVTLTIIGLIFSLGYFGFREFSRRQQVISTARALKSNLRLAQEQALAGKKPGGCLGTLNGYRFTLVGSDEYRTEALCDSNAILVKQVTLPEQIEITLTGVNPILFKPIGLGTNIPAGADVEFEVSHLITGFSNLVVVGAGGEIQ